MGSPDWETPRHLFYYWNAMYEFTVDAAASDSNHLLPKYRTKETDGLRQDWTGERVFFNPPYSQSVLGKWVAKAAKREAEVAFGLLPSNTGPKWFHKYILFQEGVELEFLPGRIAFGDPEDSDRRTPRYDNIIVVWHKEPVPFSLVKKHAV